MKKYESDFEVENPSDELLSKPKRMNRIRLIAGIIGGAAILVGVCFLIFHPENEDELLLHEYESFMGETYETVEIDGEKYIRADKEDPEKLKSMDDIRKELGKFSDLVVEGSVDMTGRDPEETTPSKETESASSSSETQGEEQEGQTEKTTDGESGTESKKEYKPGEITFEEYMALTPKEQDAYVLRCKKDKNYGLEKFMEWYRQELKKYNSTTEAPTTIHPGDIIEFGK